MRLAGGITAALVLALLGGCAQLPPPGAGQQAANPAAMRLTAVPYSALPGWKRDRLLSALPEMRASCTRLAQLPPEMQLGGAGLARTQGGTPVAWAKFCADVAAVAPGDETAVRGVVERDLQPWRISVAGSARAELTGYYEPEVDGSRVRTARYQVPIYSRPRDLVEADLGEFDPDLDGQHIFGRVSGGYLVPYWGRAAIDKGALSRRRLELFWLRTPEDAFFLQVQGSGRIRLPDGKIARVTYAGKNGLPYTPIGKVIAERTGQPASEMTLPLIRDWLDHHPADAREVMERNRSYVFFREVKGLPADEGPPGALGVPLMPERALAVDREDIPLGAPVFVATTDPVSGAPLDRLMMALDLGGAIKGALRSDIFFGWGAQAESRAGLARQSGQMFLLLPKG